MFVLSFFLVAGILYISVLIDLTLNPWLKTVKGFQWWNCFTTKHALTILYLHGGWWIILLIAFVSALTLIALFSD